MNRYAANCVAMKLIAQNKSDPSDLSIGSPAIVNSIRNHIDIVTAGSQAEAEGLVWRWVHREYPSNDGWRDHFVQVKLIPDPWPAT